MPLKVNVQCVSKYNYITVSPNTEWSHSMRWAWTKMERNTLRKGGFLR